MTCLGGAHCGKYTGYRYGGRCDKCREANNLKARETRARARSTEPRLCTRCGIEIDKSKRGRSVCTGCAVRVGEHRLMGFLATCWCEEEFVEVHPRDVLNGITHSCGRAGCRKPEGT